MEENKIENITQATNVATPTENKKGGNNRLMLLILLGLVVIFGLLIYAMVVNSGVDYLPAKIPSEVLIPTKVVDTSPSPNQVEEVDSSEVIDVDTELQDLNADVQNL